MTATALQGEAQGTIGPYGLLGKLSSGGMGIVYRARHLETGELVALKTVRVLEAVMLRGIRREIHALRRLQHPGVVRVVGEGIQDGLPWYAMELLEGLTLRRYIDGLWQRGPEEVEESATLVVSTPDTSGSPEGGRAGGYGPPSEEHRRLVALGKLPEALTVVRRLCAALAFLHGEGMVHRDLKPENVVIRPDGTPVLVDFGLASAFGGAISRESLDVSGSLEGSFLYMSPEQIKGGLVDARADLYALGCILYELVVGQPPFPGTGWEVLRRHLQDTPQPPSRWVKGVPHELESLVMRMLAKVPRERIGYAADVASVLATLGAEDLPRPPSRAPSAYLYRPEFVGRHQLLSTLETRLEEAREGRGGCVLIGGESGVGKTRLVMECAMAAGRHAIRVVTGGCLPLSGGQPGDREVHGEPLHAFKSLLQALADECRQRGLEGTEKLLGARGPVLALYEPALAELAGQEELPEPPRLPPQAARERFMRCLAETLVAFTEEQPLLLVVDDWQWADELSLGVLDFLQANVLPRSRVLVVGTWRTEARSAPLEALLAAPGVTRLELGRMDEALVAQMVEDMLALSSPPEAFVRFLTTRSAGNPFFVAEYLRTAIDERLLVRDVFGQWRLAGGGDALERLHEALPLPGTAHDLVGRRLEGLEPGLRGLLEVAAVLGRETEGEVLEAAAGLGEPQQWEALEALRARHVLEDLGGGRLRFVHDKLREIAYEGIPPERRRVLHRAAALALEGHHAAGEVPPSLYAALAHHWEMAGDDVWTFEYLEKAGRHALEAGAHGEAAGWLRRALELDGQRGGREASVRVDAARRARWERLLAEALFRMSDYDACTAFSRRALEDLGRPLPDSLGGWVRFLLRQVGQQVLHLVRPLDRVRAEDPGEREAQGAAALAAVRLAECYYWRYEPLQMAATALLAANLAERSGRDAEVLRLYGQLGSIAGMARLDSLARTYFRRAQGEGQPVEDPSATALGLILECMYHACFARWSPAAAKASEAQRVLLRLGDRGEYELAVVLLGHVDFYTGRFQAALERFAEVRESARKRGHLQHEIWAPYSMARSLLALGRWDEALPLLRESWGLLERKGDLLSTLICGGLLARAHLARGEWEQAREQADGVMALARRLPPLLFTEGHGYEGAALTYLALWEREQEGEPGARPAVAELAREACGRLRAFAMRFPVGQPMALRCTGRLHWLSGHRWRARAAWRRAIRLAREMGMLYEEAVAWLELARAAEPGSTERETCRQEALGGFTRLGCEALVREAEALKARPIGG